VGIVEKVFKVGGQNSEVKVMTRWINLWGIHFNGMGCWGFGSFVRNVSKSLQYSLKWFEQKQSNGEIDDF